MKLGGRNESSPGVMSAGCLERTSGAAQGGELQPKRSPGMHFLFEDIRDTLACRNFACNGSGEDRDLCES